MSLYIDKEKTKNTIAFVLDKMGTEADLLLLDEYYRLFKKEVSLFNRSRFAAYLLMLHDQGKISQLGKNAARKTDAGSAKYVAHGEEENTQRYPLAEEESKRLFFSVGRSRRVYPREILGLINTKTAIPREDIGAIRILDNYSFVQVRDTVAEKVIEALNGMNFRGRSLTVNYAKSRDVENTPDSEQDEDHSEKEDI